MNEKDLKALLAEHKPPWTAVLGDKPLTADIIFVADVNGKIIFTEKSWPESVSAMRLPMWKAMVALVNQQPAVERLRAAGQVIIVDQLSDDTSIIAISREMHDNLKSVLATFDTPVQPAKPRYSDEAVERLREAAAVAIAEMGPCDDEGLQLHVFAIKGLETALAAFDAPAQVTRPRYSEAAVERLKSMLVDEINERLSDLDDPRMILTWVLDTLTAFQYEAST